MHQTLNRIHFCELILLINAWFSHSSQQLYLSLKHSVVLGLVVSAAGWQLPTLLWFLLRMWSGSRPPLWLEPHQPFDLSPFLSLSLTSALFPSLFFHHLSHSPSSVSHPALTFASITFMSPPHSSLSLSLCCSAQAKVTPDHRLPPSHPRRCWIMQQSCELIQCLAEGQARLIRGQDPIPWSRGRRGPRGLHFRL